MKKETDIQKAKRLQISLDDLKKMKRRLSKKPNKDYIKRDLYIKAKIHYSHVDDLDYMARMDYIGKPY